MSVARLSSPCVVLALVCAGCGYLSHESRGSSENRDKSSGIAGQGAANASDGMGDPRAVASADPAAPLNPTQESSAGTYARPTGSNASQQYPAHAGTGGRDGDPSVAANGSTDASQPRGDGAATGSASEPKPEVWVGELWSLGRMLCPLQPPFETGMDIAARTERVLLLIDADSDSHAPTGRIRFGQGELPATPSPEPQSMSAYDHSWGLSESLFTCSSELLAEGGEYSLLDSERSSSRLMFVVAPAEIWAPWCTSRHWMAKACPVPAICDDPWILCPCTAAGCEPRVGARIRFDFRVDGDEMETLVEGSVPYAEVRLERVQ